jgi:hypothetical protein
MPETITAPRRRPVRLIGTAAVTIVAAVLAVGLTGSPAAAVGTPVATCPGGTVSRVADIVDFPYQTSGPTPLDSGFYAGSGGYAPPETEYVCQTAAGSGALSGQPFLKLFTGTCPSGYLPFGIPDEHSNYQTQTTVTWGSFLPAGWYALGHTKAADAGWVTVCWFPKAPFNPAGGR